MALAASSAVQWYRWNRCTQEHRWSPPLPHRRLPAERSVAELREFLAPPGLLQLTTDLQNDAMAALIAAFFSQDPDIPPPDPGGTLYLPYHLHFTDAGGDALLLEATPDGGWAVFDTRVVTNEPAFPLLQQWVEEFTAFDWSAVPGTQREWACGLGGGAQPAWQQPSTIGR